MQKTTRIHYLDALRVVGMFAVMVVHLSATGHKTAAAGTGEWIICWCYDFLSRFAVPVFVMISGALFLDPDRNISLRGLVKKHILRLAVVFLGWSAVYACTQSLLEYPFLSEEYLTSVVQKTVTGHYHMWYLHLIMGLYTVTPLLRPAAANRKLLKLLILLAFALSYGLQLLSHLPVVASANIRLLVGYAGYYCLGYYLHSTQISKKRVTFLCLGAAVLMTAVAAAGISAGATQTVFQENMPHILLYSAAVFLAFKRHGALFSRAAIEKLAACSLGMYLVHPAANFVLNRLGLRALTFWPLLCVPLCAITVFAISFTVVRIMKKSPLLKWFV